MFQTSIEVLLHDGAEPVSSGHAKVRDADIIMWVSIALLVSYVPLPILRKPKVQQYSTYYT